MKLVRRQERGQSILEVMIAAAVFSIGALGILPLAYRAAGGMSSSLKLTQATALADSLLSTLTAQPYDALIAGEFAAEETNVAPDGTNKTPDGGETGAWEAQDGWFYRAYTITEQDIGPALGNDYKEISVTVSWWDASMQSVRSVSLVGGKAAPQ